MNADRDDDEEEAVAHSEGAVARTIEYQTARVPSDVFLWTAIAAGGAAAYFYATGRTRLANGVAQLAPSLLIMGLYNKLVKVAGSDRVDHQAPVNRRELLH